MIETSVIILHYNKNYELNLVLEAFANQSENLETFELIIIDDGSEFSLKDIVGEYQAKDLNINLQELPHTGNRAYNRNLAVNLAKGNILIFFDADMIPCRTFIENHKKNILANDNLVSLGYRNLLYYVTPDFITVDTVKNNFKLIETIPCFLDERVSMIHMHQKIGLDLSHAWYLVYSHNIALRKDLYKSIQGFDEGFRFGWGAEDVEFGFQLFKVGAKFFFDQNIISYHMCHFEAAGKNEQYERNLLYFYDKYKSYEPELFMHQHHFDTYTMCKLYQLVLKGSHLQELKENIIEYEQTLFVGFANNVPIMQQKGNSLISTNNEFAEYPLIGSYTPYDNYLFNFVIISDNYSVFPTEYLYLVVNEALRIGKEVFFYSFSNGIISLDDFWKIKTGYSFDEFNNLKKIRVVMTPGSDNRQNNVLYAELVKALNENNYYASLDLAFDEYKDQSDIFPLTNNPKMAEYYHRDIKFFTNSETAIIDYISPGVSLKDSSNICYWGDLPYYNQNIDDYIQEKRIYNNFIFRIDRENRKLLKPGINAEKINRYLQNANKENGNNGIVIIDLNLENLPIIKSIVSEISKNKLLSNIQITIVTLNVLLEENKIFKSSKYRNPEIMNTKKWKAVVQYQEAFLQRIKELIDISIGHDNINIVHSNGSLEEIDYYLERKKFYIDLNTKHTFNPYVIQAAAYGLQVFTTSDLYDSYCYDNINKIDYENISAIYDNPIFLNPDNSVKKEICYYKRKIKVDCLINAILCKSKEIKDIQKLININNKNSWSSALNSQSKNFMKNLDIH